MNRDEVLSAVSFLDARGQPGDAPKHPLDTYRKANDVGGAVARLAAGIQEGDRGKHLVSIHPDPSPPPPVHARGTVVELQLDSSLERPSFDLSHDAHGLRKIAHKTATMLEEFMRKARNTDFRSRPLLVRREAYYTCLAGGFHGYGHNESVAREAGLARSPDDPGAQQMTILKNVFTGLLEWWTMIPDQTVFNRGGNIQGDVLNLAARSTTGQWLVCYLAGEANVSINMSKITTGEATSAAWINPATGERLSIELFRQLALGFSPGPLAGQDAVLVVTSLSKGNRLSN